MKEIRKYDWIKANIVSIVATIIAGILAWYTYGLYQVAFSTLNTADQANKKFLDKASQSADATTKAADAAANANTISKNIYKLDSIRDAKELFQDSVKIRAEIDFQKQSLDAQINSLKETQREFEIENTPYLQVNNIIISPIDSVRKLAFNYTVVNYGKNPAKIIDATEVLLYSPYDYGYDSLKYMAVKVSPLNIDAYVIQNNPNTDYFQSANRVPDKYWERIINGTMYIYLNIKIKYINLVSQKNRLYELWIRMVYTKKFGKPMTVGDRIYNENTTP